MAWLMVDTKYRVIFLVVYIVLKKYFVGSCSVVLHSRVKYVLFVNKDRCTLLIV